MFDDEGIVFTLGEIELESHLDQTVAPLLSGLEAACQLVRLIPEAEPELMCAASGVRAFIDRLKRHPKVEELRAKAIALHELQLTVADPEEHLHSYTAVYSGPLFPPDGTEGESKMINVAVCYCTAVALEEM